MQGKNKTAQEIAHGCIARLLRALTVVAIVSWIVGCATSRSAQPTKAQTQNNDIRHCSITVNVYGSGGEMPGAELLTQTQSLESSGTETYSPMATQTPTNDTRLRLDARYNDAIASATEASRSVLSQIGGGLGAVLDLMLSRKSGTVQVQKSDGTPATIQCEDGQCAWCPDCAEP